MQACELKSLNRKVAKPLRLRKVRLQNIPPLAYSLRLRAFAVQLLDHLDFLNLSDLPDEIRSSEPFLAARAAAPEIRHFALHRCYA